MSVTTAAISTRRQIRQSLERWKGGLGDAELPLFRAFVEDTLNRLRGPFLAHHPPIEVLEYFEVAFRFARTRKKGEVKVEVRPGPQKGVNVMTDMDDQAFIVDTIRLFLRRGQADYWGGFNVVFHAKRDEQGNLVGVGDDGAAESLVLLEADSGSLLADPKASAAALKTNLELARAMVTDFKPMTRTVERYAEKFEVQAEREPDKAEAWSETAQFLKWLLRENFVFMGVDTLSADGRAIGESLGIQKVSGSYYGTPEGDWPPPHEPLTVQVRKSRIESPVHRAGRVDEILVTVPGHDGEADQKLFLRGMFTYRAVTQPSRNVPILRGVLASILDQQQSRPGSFRYKGIANVYDSLPTEFLFTASRQAIAEMVDLVFEAEQQQEVGVTFLMTGPDSAFCLVAMPKGQYSDELRRDLEKEIVGTLQATYSDHGLFVGRYDTVLLHYYLTGVVFPGDAGVQKMTDNIRHLATPWLARLWHDLSERFDERVADRLADTYGRAFPETWVRGTPVDRAVRDISLLESLQGDKDLVADVWQDKEGDLRLSLYQAKDVYLTDILPVLDNFGLVVIDGFSTPVGARGGHLFIDSFHLEGTKGLGRDVVLAHKDTLVPAVEAVFAGKVEADRLNQLVLSAGLSWTEVDVVRGLCRYCRQLQVKLALVRMHEILLTHPTATKHLVDLFHAKFDPDAYRDGAGQAGAGGDRDAAVASAEDVVRADLKKINAADEDLLISTLLGLLLAMIRTNYYRTDRVLHYLSFKFDCAKVKEMGVRRPMFEIYVHNKEVEGVHLRFGKVARGGIRWSDRDDFRTEVLGLASTQQVKNVVIVPEGCKGGFYLKRPSRDAATRRQEADLYYQTFIRGLLDLTDNSKGGQLVKPPRVVCYDGDDPYLVVAADKGTAHLSDTANKLSLAYGHWLGDAFASGGSNGYDHKKVGITARGGWVLVKRHFAELGKDAYKEPFTCIGIGDMSGDVFGNGLIETPYTRLLAAFNHVHIFLDPDPDPKSSYEERLRLFRAERKGGWENYDKTKISKGGGVFDRAAKAIPLSEQAQRMLNLYQDEAAPDLVIQHILQMEVDLLWNGGIGTYVKASFETHADADDRSNDALRVDASQLRCKIVGEGGNLGFTQRARIEAGLLGIRLNTDAIDNSGGVDLSDHEVNLKILLDRVVSRGDMTLDARNELLERMTDAVAHLVLGDNDAQGRQLSRDQLRSKTDIFDFARAIAFVERTMNVSRETLRLPSDKELAKRAEDGLGLTRPELAVLQAWVKMYVYRELVKDAPKTLPGYESFLVNYFPKELQQAYPDDIRNHMLANEIAMTVATTRIVGDAGAAFFPLVIETTGRSVTEIAAAYLKAQRVVRVDELRPELEELKKSTGLAALYKAWIRVDQGARDVLGFWMRNRVPSEDELEAISQAADHVFAMQPADVVAKMRDQTALMKKEDISEAVARRVLQAGVMGVALAVHAEAKRLGVALPEMAVRHLAVARASRLGDIIDDLAKRPAAGRWDPIALQILHGHFSQLLRQLVSRTPVEGPARSVDELAAALAIGPLAPVRQQVEQLLGTDVQPSIATLLVLEDRLSSLVARTMEAQSGQAVPA